MSLELRTNTAVRIPVGPLVDPDDGKTAETALTVTALSVQIYQVETDGSAVTRAQFSPTASGGSNDMTLVTSSTDGMYDLELTATQLNWLGGGKITFYDVDGFLVHWMNIHVVSANYFDFKYGSTLLPVNATQISSSTTAANDVEANIGYLDASISSRGTSDLAVSDLNTACDTVTVTSMAADVVTASALATDAVNEIQSGLATASALTSHDTDIDSQLSTIDGKLDTIDNFLDTEVAAILEDTDSTIPGLLSALETHGDSTWSTATGFATTAGTSAIQADIAALSFATTAQADTIDAKIDSLNDFDYTTQNVTLADGAHGGTSATITLNDYSDFLGSGSSLTLNDIADAVWDEDLTTHTDTDSTGEALGSAVSGGVSAGTIAGAVWDAATSSYVDTGSFGKLVGDNLDATVSSRGTADPGDEMDLVNAPNATAVTAIQSGLAPASEYDTQMARITANVATASALSTVDGKIDTIDDEVGAIQTDLDNATDGLGAIKTAVDSASTHSAADVWSVGTRALTDKADFTVTGTIDADVVSISGSTDAADKLEASAETIETGAAITGTLSTTQMSTNLAEATDDHYNGRVIIWTSGVLLRQATAITDYDGTNKILTFTAVTEAPSNTDTFVIV